MRIIEARNSILYPLFLYWFGATPLDRYFVNLSNKATPCTITAVLEDFVAFLGAFVPVSSILVCGYIYMDIYVELYKPHVPREEECYRLKVEGLLWWR
jgi:hypothetical protein